ncbi:MAG: methyltransferase domain-containing protein [Pseudomonadota bacterium]
MNPDKETLAAYADKAEDYADLAYNDTQMPELAELASMVGPGDHVLDLGCGPGMHMIPLAAGGAKVTGFDPSPEFVEIGKRDGLDIRLAGFDDLDAVETYDAILASFSLLHAPRDAFPGHLAQIHRALKPGGAFVIGMKTGTGEHRDSLGRFYVYYTLDELHTALTAAGFAVLKTREGEGKGLAGTSDPYAVITTHRP